MDITKITETMRAAGLDYEGSDRHPRWWTPDARVGVLAEDVETRDNVGEPATATTFVVLTADGRNADVGTFNDVDDAIRAAHAEHARWARVLRG